MLKRRVVPVGLPVLLAFRFVWAQSDNATTEQPRELPSPTVPNAGGAPAERLPTLEAPKAAGGATTIFTRGGTIYSSTGLPSQVVPNPRGGASIYTPGQWPSQIVPNAKGGGTLYTPGEPPAQVVPNADGGATIYSPGHPPRVIRPK